MYLLDTNVVSEIRKPVSKIEPNVARWITTLELKTTFLSAISLMELEIGALRLIRRDSKQGAALRDWIDNKVKREFDGRILALDTTVALQCARLHVPNPASDRDALIAATALVHHLTVATRNFADFAAMNVRLVNPWQPQN